MSKENEIVEETIIDQSEENKNTIDYNKLSDMILEKIKINNEEIKTWTINTINTTMTSKPKNEDKAEQKTLKLDDF